MATAGSAPPETFVAARGLRWLGGFAAFGLTVSAVYATTGLGLPCPFRAITGWQCPFCGGTRLGDALLHGDVAAAFWFNPLVFVGLVALSVLGVLWLVEVFGGPRLRLPKAVAASVRGLHPTAWLVLGALAAAAYVLVRNLL